MLVKETLCPVRCGAAPGPSPPLPRLWFISRWFIPGSLFLFFHLQFQKTFPSSAPCFRFRFGYLAFKMSASAGTEGSGLAWHSSGEPTVFWVSLEQYSARSRWKTLQPGNEEQDDFFHSLLFLFLFFRLATTGHSSVTTPPPKTSFPNWPFDRSSKRTST